MKKRCDYCEGTGKLGPQNETCSFCGGIGYLSDLVHRMATIDSSCIKQIKDVRNVRYNGDLEEYFKQISECDITNDLLSVLSDIYYLISEKTNS